MTHERHLIRPLSYPRLNRLSFSIALVPALIVILVQVALLAGAVVSALTDDAGRLTFAHIARVSADPLFLKSLVYNSAIPVASVVLEALLGTGLALWFLSFRRGKTLWRTVAIVPFAVPEIVYLFTMKLVFREHGYLNSLLVGSLGMDHGVGWLQPNTLLMAVSIALIDAWRVTPFVFLIVLAALEQLPQQYTDAARLDGANWWKVARFIHLPLVLPALGVAVALRSIDAFRIFATPLVLVGVEGMPVLSSMAYHYRAHLNDSAGANVAALVLTLGMIALSSILLLLFQRRRAA